MSFVLATEKASIAIRRNQMKRQFTIGFLAGVVVAVVCMVFVKERSAVAAEAGKTRVFEVRTYYTHPGKMPDLHKRFREHTTKLFEKHGMANIGYWTPVDGENAENILYYVLAHENVDAAK